MLLPHQPIAALAEQSLDNKASRMCTPDSFSIVALAQWMVLLRILLHCSSVIPSSISWLGKTDWPLTGMYIQEPCFHKLLPRHIAHDSYGIILQTQIREEIAIPPEQKEIVYSYHAAQREEVTKSFLQH